MADVILFRPRLTKKWHYRASTRLPLGILTVAVPLLENHYTVRIIDEEFTPDWQEILKNELTDSTVCVGVSALTGWQIAGGLNFSQFVKNQNGRIPVVWGGVHASILPEQTLQNSLIDIVVRGEGENAFLQVVNALNEGNALKGIGNVWYKVNGEIYSNPDGPFIDLGSQRPFWSYPLVDYERYINSSYNFLGCKRYFELNTDRGCPHNCAFCYNLNFNKGRWRALSAPRIVEQLKYLTRTFAVDGVNFTSDNFFTDKKRIHDLCDGIIKERIKVAWKADCRVDYFAGYEDSFLELLKRSGCKTLSFGVESGSQRIIDSIDKDIRLEDVFKVNEKVKKWGLGANYYFMVGFPGETKKDVLETYKVMMELYLRNPGVKFLGPKIYTPFPGTPLYEKCVRSGFKPPQKTEDWVSFDWRTEESHLPLFAPRYTKWMKKSVSVSNYFFMNDFKLLRWWFKLRVQIMIKFGIIGLLPERKILQIARMILYSLRRPRRAVHSHNVLM